MVHDEQGEFASWTSSSGVPLTEKLCELAVATLPVEGSAIFIFVGATVQGPLASAGRFGAQVAEIEQSLGEGPVFELLQKGRAVMVGDLSVPTEIRWPHLREAVLAVGVRAIHSFPLHLGAVQLGALELYSSTPGQLDVAAMSDCYAIADLTTSTLLFLQAGLADSQFTDLLATADADRLRIHQATGMVAESLDCSLGDALARMRAYAFSHSLTLYDVSTQIIERNLRLEK